MLFYLRLKGKGKGKGKGKADGLLIEELSAGLARVEEQAVRLPIAREEVVRVLGEPSAAESSAAEEDPSASGLNGARSMRRAGPVSRMATVTGPSWQEWVGPQVGGGYGDRA